MHSAHRGSRLVFVSSRRERRQLSDVTSRKSTSSVRTWVLRETHRERKQIREQLYVEDLWFIIVSIRKKKQSVFYCKSGYCVVNKSNLVHKPSESGGHTVPVRVWVSLPECGQHKFPRGLDVCLADEIFPHHNPRQTPGETDTWNTKHTQAFSNFCHLSSV